MTEGAEPAEWGQTIAAHPASSAAAMISDNKAFIPCCQKGHTWQAYSGVRFELEYAPGFFVDLNCPVCVLNVLLTFMQGVRPAQEEKP